MSFLSALVPNWAATRWLDFFIALALGLWCL
jgi:hypothetical protein